MIGDLVDDDDVVGAEEGNNGTGCVVRLFFFLFLRNRGDVFEDVDDNDFDDGVVNDNVVFGFVAGTIVVDEIGNCNDCGCDGDGNETGVLDCDGVVLVVDNDGHGSDNDKGINGFND